MVRQVFSLFLMNSRRVKQGKTTQKGSHQGQALSLGTRYQSPVWRETTMETMVGKVIHYNPKIGVAAVILKNHLAQGDQIHIYGPHDDVHQSGSLMEIEHVPIKEANRGQDVGIKVTGRVHPGDMVFCEI